MTGEKYRARTEFWSALAHTDIIGRIKRMVEHYAIVGDFIDKPLVYNRAELIAWLTERTANCLACYPYFVSGETLVKPGEVYSPSTHHNLTDHPKFTLEFFAKMKEIGLGWKEFTLYYRMWLERYYVEHPDEVADDWSKEKIFRWQPHPENIFNECIQPEVFVNILDEIAANRRRLRDLPAAVLDPRP